MTEQCLVLIKPDAIIKHLTGDILAKLAETNLHIVGSKVVQVTKELAEEHYQHLREEKFFDELIKYIMGHYHMKSVLALVYEGDGACAKIRKCAGATNPEEAEPHSVRGKYGRITSKGIFENVVHASENPKEGEREIKLWFRPDELISTIYPTEMKEAKIEKMLWKED
ncbi:nucleoside-diphosphate kinase [Candidatus Woesearchaeota archaeon]|nr:nucleoside-diphosphate kinase [Candidatus Woesearchaeota archaeon]